MSSQLRVSGETDARNALLHGTQPSIFLPLTQATRFFNSAIAVLGQKRYSCGKGSARRLIQAAVRKIGSSGF
jgi:hypothetical protein